MWLISSKVAALRAALPCLLGSRRTRSVLQGIYLVQGYLTFGACSMNGLSCGHAACTPFCFYDGASSGFTESENSHTYLGEGRGLQFRTAINVHTQQSNGFFVTSFPYLPTVLEAPHRQTQGAPWFILQCRHTSVISRFHLDRLSFLRTRNGKILDLRPRRARPFIARRSATSASLIAPMVARPATSCPALGASRVSVVSRGARHTYVQLPPSSRSVCGTQCRSASARRLSRTRALGCFSPFSLRIEGEELRSCPCLHICICVHCI